MNYTPDTYQFLRLSSDQDTDVILKLFAAWSGGYLTGDSWKLNSGVVKIVKEDNVFHVHGYSGSVYTITAEQGTMTSYGSTILNKILESGVKQNIKVELISLEEALKEKQYE